MRLGSAAAVTFCVAAVPVWGQENPLPDLFSDVIDVRVVNVEAVVTDRKGNRIRGLEAKDFELLVDGEPVPIRYFTEIDGGYARGPSDAPVGTSYLIFIDDLHAIKQHRDRVLSRIEQDLALLTPADQVAVVAFDGSTISLLVDWTNSPSRIKQALAQARQRKPRGLPSRVDLAYRTDQTRKAVMAATATIRSFAHAPGRKAMLLLAEGWREPHFRYVLGSGPSRPSLKSLYSPLVHAANLVGYSLYPVDIPGPRTAPARTLLRAESARYRMRQGTSEFHSPSDRHSDEQSVQPRYSSYYSYTSPDWLVVRSRRESDEHRVFRYLARQTGGQPMIDAYRDKALSEAVADTRSFYWLSFEPPRKEDDKLHHIKVRLAGHRGLQVRSREHYLDMSRSTELSMLVEGSLLFGASPGASTLGVRLGTPRNAGFGRVAVPMEVTIPFDDLVLLPMDGRWMNELELRIAMISDRGDLSREPVRKIPLARIDEPVPGEVLIYEAKLLMPKPRHRYVATVYEPVSGAILSASGELGEYGETTVSAASLAEGSRPYDCSSRNDILEVCLGAPRETRFGKVYVPLEVKIPLDDLTLQPIEAVWRNDLEFRLIVIDEQGNRSKGRVSKIPIRGSRPPRPGDYFVYETDLRVRSRQERYIAEVHDPLSDTTLSASGLLATHAGSDPRSEGVR